MAVANSPALPGGSGRESTSTDGSRGKRRGQRQRTPRSTTSPTSFTRLRNRLIPSTIESSEATQKFCQFDLANVDAQFTLKNSAGHHSCVAHTFRTIALPLRFVRRSCPLHLAAGRAPLPLAIVVPAPLRGGASVCSSPIVRSGRLPATKGRSAGHAPSTALRDSRLLAVASAGPRRHR